MTEIERILRRQDFMRKEVNSWSRFQTVSSSITDRVIAVDYYQASNRSFEICEGIVTEAVDDGTSDGDHMLSMLVDSAADAHLEIDFGEGKFVRENTPGSVVFGTAQSERYARGLGPFHSIVLYMNNDCLTRSVEELTAGRQHKLERLHTGSFKDDGIQILLKMLLEFHRTQSETGQSLYDNTSDILDRIIFRLLHQTGQKQADLVKDTKLSSSSMRRVIEYIHSKPMGEFQRDELANIAGVSSAHFSRMFRQTIGISPKQYLIQRRIESSKLMLKQRHFSIAQIAEQLGYTHVSHFHNEFVRHLGVTPAAFRKYH